MRTLGRPDLQVVKVHGIITGAPCMLEMLRLVERVAQSDAPVLIRGATGTGKELVARALHALSPRGSEPMSAINCAMLSSELLTSELFGHRRGAFTGAVADRQGLFALADKGSIFLDEIAEMPIDIQPRLLRVLQDQTFTPLGGTDSVRVDVRVMSATHRALRDEVNAGRFREDLMYRVRVVPIFLPRLAQRQGDIELLTWQFIDELNERGLREIGVIDAAAMEAMLDYDWPGNVRELRNVIEYAFAVGEGDVLTLDELTPELRGEPPFEGEQASADAIDVERRRIAATLQEVNGRKSEAARLLGMSRTTLWRKLREHRLDKGRG